MNSSTAGAALTRMADAIDTQDWQGLAALLNRDYPGHWRFVRDVVVDAGSTAVLRARDSDAAEESPEVHYAASFGTVDDAGRLIRLDELWAEVVAPPQGDRRPDTAVGGGA